MSNGFSVDAVIEANALYQKSSYRDALDLYKKILDQLEPQEHFCYYLREQMGLCYFYMVDYVSAIHLFEQCSEFWNERGDERQKATNLGHINASKRCLGINDVKGAECVAEILADDPFAKINLARCYRIDKRFDDAILWLNSSREYLEESDMGILYDEYARVFESQNLLSYAMYFQSLR